MSNTVKEARRLQEQFFIEVTKVAREQGMTYDKDIADKAGISRSLYSMMKKGDKPMSISSGVKICRVLKLEWEIRLV